MGITKRQYEKAAKAARKAIEKMNDGGKHWMKGQWTYTWVTQDRERITQHCFLGGVEAALKLPPAQHHARLKNIAFLLVIEEAVQAIPRKKTRYAEIVKEYGELSEVFEAARLDKFDTRGEPTKKLNRRTKVLEGVVMEYNDAQRRVWTDVKDTLTAVANKLDPR